MSQHKRHIMGFIDRLKMSDLKYWLFLFICLGHYLYMCSQMKGCQARRDSNKIAPG